MKTMARKQEGTARTAWAMMMMMGTFTAVAQQQDSTRTIDLEAVSIEANAPHNEVVRMPDVDGTVIIAGKKNEVVRVSTLDADLSTNNARQVFAKVPGISVWENDGSGIQVGVAARGLSPNRSWEFNVRQNGYDICGEAFGYPEAYYSPPMEAVERIELVRGAASLQFGPQFGGLLNYKLKTGVRGRKVAFETRQTVGSYGLYNAYNGIGGTIGKVSYYAFYHHRSADGWRANSRYATNTGHASITYAPNKRMTIGAEYTRMDFASQQPGGLTESLFQRDPQASLRQRNWFGAPWNVAALTLDHQLAVRTRISVKAFATLAERNSVGFLRPINEPDTINRATGTYADRQVDRDAYANIGAELRLLHRYRLFGREHNLAIGARAYRGSTKRWQQGKGNAGNDFDIALRDPVYGKELRLGTDNIAFFAENQFKLSDRLSFVPGIRYELIDASVEGRIRADGTGELPRTAQQRRVFLYGFGGQYRTTATTNAYANYSRAYRPVLYSELTPSATTDMIDPNLKDATGFNADLGYRGTIGRYLSFDIGGFLLHYNDRVGTVQRDGVAYRTNIGAMVSQGLEAFAEIDPVRMLVEKPQFGSVSLFCSIAIIDAHYTRWNNPALLNDPVHGIEGKRAENAPERIERYGLNYVLGRFSAMVQLSRVGDVYTDAANTEAPNVANTVGRLPSYEVLDVSASLGFANGLEFRGGVNNSADAHYATRRAGGYPGPGLLPANGRTFYFTVGARF